MHLKVRLKWETRPLIKKKYPFHNYDFENNSKLNLYGGKPIAGKDYDRSYLPLIPNVTEFKKF